MRWYPQAYETVLPDGTHRRMPAGLAVVWGYLVSQRGRVVPEWELSALMDGWRRRAGYPTQVRVAIHRLRQLLGHDAIRSCGIGSGTAGWSAPNVVVRFGPAGA